MKLSSTQTSLIILEYPKQKVDALAMLAVKTQQKTMFDPNGGV